MRADAEPQASFRRVATRYDRLAASFPCCSLHRRHRPLTAMNLEHGNALSQWLFG
jgi:hypothetical protein